MKKKKSNLSMMKRKIGMIFTLFLFLQSLSVGVSYAQSAEEPRLTVEFKETPFVDVLSYIKRHTKYELLYNNEEVGKIPAVTHNFKSAPLSEILRLCLEGTEYTYRFYQNMIVIQKRQKTIEPIAVRGKVLDDRGDVLPGATVIVKGTTIGGSTNDQGLFVFNLPRMDTIHLLVSFVGMETKEVVVIDFDKEIVVRLNPDTKEMDEVVVTGYGNIRKSSFTGNSITVTQAELMKVSKSNVLKALEMYDPSFRLKTNNEWGSDPNALPEMQIRGQTSIGVTDLDRNSLSKSALQNNPNLPIFILDGFETTIQKVYDMDPNRIESVTLLKDAAATAMYGSRATNGVVIITTVPPKAGETQVTFNFVGTVTMPNLNDYNLMNAKEKLEAEVAAGLFEIDPDEYYSSSIRKMEEYQKKLNNVLEGVNTYWLSKPLRTGFDPKFSLGITGGAHEFRYGLDLFYDKVNGVMKGSDRERIEAALTFTYLTKKFQVSNQTNYGVTKSEDTPYGNFSMYAKAQPYEKYKDENGKLLQNLQWTQSFGSAKVNPLYEATLGNYNRNKVNTLLNNTRLHWYISPTFHVSGEISISHSLSKGRVFIDPLSARNVVEYGDDDTYVGSLTVTDAEDTRFNGKLAVAYNELIEKHHITFSGTFEVITTRNSNSSGEYKGFQSSEFSSPEFARDLPNKPYFADNKTRMLGILAQLNYTYDNIYLMDASLRFDGSSEFGSDKRFAPFWSTGLGVNIHNYESFKNWGFFDQLRVRGSYGVTGKLGYEPYAALPTHEIDVNEWYISGPASSLMSTRGNRELGWEKTSQLDFGLEVGFLKRLVYLKASYYDRTTNNLITDVTLPSSTGFTTYISNMGKTVNRGFELDFRSDLINTADWYVAVFANMGHSITKIKKISDALKAYNERVNEFYNQKVDYWDDNKPNLNRVLTKYVEGESLTAKYGMKSLGIDPANGRELYMNRDGSLTYDWSGAEMQPIGDEEPWAKGSFGMNARWKGLSLYVGFQYEFGGDMYNTTLIEKVENADFSRYNVDRRAMSLRWKEFGDVTRFRDIQDYDATTNPTSRFMQKNNWLELTSLRVEYEFDRPRLKKFGMETLTLSVGSNNLWRMSTIKTERGLSYPFANTVDFSVRVRF